MCSAQCAFANRSVGGDGCSLGRLGAPLQGPFRPAPLHACVTTGASTPIICRVRRNGISSGMGRIVDAKPATLNAPAVVRYRPADKSSLFCTVSLCFLQVARTKRHAKVDVHDAARADVEHDVAPVAVAETWAVGARRRKK